ncbi:arsenite methyltransferase [Candidatus Thiosymbion oneisti]|uniref:arsenite methyltransferase n=1 Tax=Candidatus Thiosymbion oneisti TaxID=589554 RepID=UPI000AC3406F|nr:arsenite methyltransferase [Candidatus Thiosymbion oneisti]
MNKKTTETKAKTEDDIRSGVRKAYAAVAATHETGACCGEPNNRCGVPAGPIGVASTRLGYSAEDLVVVPEGADMGLGCGNPRAIAALKAGEVVIDLGSGGGFDCFLAAREVGAEGRVIGIDMTPDMLSKARTNAQTGGYANVEFRLGEIEHLPVADTSVDVIISNCVVNLSPDKQQVFRDAYRVLKSGGRLAISDVVTTAELPDEVKSDQAMYSGCVSGAASSDAVRAMLEQAGFLDIRIEPKDESREFIKDWAPGRAVDDYVVSAYIEARKP